MSKKVYRTAQGKNLDLGALQLQNESVRAVGNMSVNANGDKINTQNKTVDSRVQRVSGQYKKQISRNNVSDDVVQVSKKSTQKQKTKPAKVKEPVVEDTVVEEQIAEPAQKEPVVTDSAPSAVPTKSVIKNNKTGGGLADAIAKAKSVKQEPMKTPRQVAQSRSGVKKI